MGAFTVNENGSLQTADRVVLVGLGYLAGPTIGTLFFKAINGSRNKAMDVMDKR